MFLIFHVKLKLNKFKFRNIIFFIITPFIEELLRRTKKFEFLNLLFSYLCTKSKLEELRGHKVVAAMWHRFDLVYSPVDGYVLKMPAHENNKEAF